MKVADVGRIAKDNMPNIAVLDKPQTSGAGSSFQQHMSDLSQAEYEEYIESLKERITEQGEKIKKNANISEFLLYRKLLSELIGEAAGSAYAASKKDTFDSRGKHKVFTIIKKVNEKLDEMAQEILSQQSDNISLIQMVDDIRGLLVDLLL